MQKVCNSEDGGINDALKLARLSLSVTLIINARRRTCGQYSEALLEQKDTCAKTNHDPYVWEILPAVSTRVVALHYIELPFVPEGAGAV